MLVLALVIGRVGFSVGGMSAEQEIDVEYVARLARVSLTDDERERFAGQLGEVLDFFRKLRSVDVEGVEPLAHAFALENVWQADVPEPGLAPEVALANAPAQRQGQVVVPKVVEDA